MNIHEAGLVSSGLRFGVIVSRFNSLITERLWEGALDCIVRHGGAASDVELVRVPGCWEIPLAAKWMAERGRHDAIIALGLCH